MLFVVKKTWWIALLLVASFILLSVSSVVAASSTDTGMKIWPAKTTNEVNKVWTISFNSPLLSTSVNSNNVYVTTSKQAKVATTVKLSADGLSVTVTPSKAYTDGDYNLYITNGVKSWDIVQLSEIVIVPFTVIVPTQPKAPTPVAVPISYTSSVNLVVTVTDDFKAVYPEDISGLLSLEGSNGNRLGPSSKDLLTGKYTFNIYTDDTYSLHRLSVSKGVINNQSVKLPKITVPVIKIPSTGLTTTPKPAERTANLVISTKEGVVGSKSGSIGGRIEPEQYGVPVTVSNATTTWTTRTDIDGYFLFYLPSGSYQVDVDGYDARYKKSRYKLTVAAGQMASSLERINIKELIGTLGLKLDPPLVDLGSGVVSGIDSTTKQISGTVNLDAMVEIYDTTPAIPTKIITVKPNKDGKFIAKIPSSLVGKKLQIKVIDSAENVYTLEMTNAVE